MHSCFSDEELELRKVKNDGVITNMQERQMARGLCIYKQDSLITVTHLSSLPTDRHRAIWSTYLYLLSQNLQIGTIVSNWSWEAHRINSNSHRDSLLAKFEVRLLFTSWFFEFCQFSFNIRLFLPILVILAVKFVNYNFLAIWIFFLYFPFALYIYLASTILPLIEIICFGFSECLWMQTKIKPVFCSCLITLVKT